jgi:hypothetical protein
MWSAIKESTVPIYILLFICVGAGFLLPPILLGVDFSDETNEGRHFGYGATMGFILVGWLFGKLKPIFSDMAITWLEHSIAGWAVRFFVFCFLCSAVGVMQAMLPYKWALILLTLAAFSALCSIVSREHKKQV